LTNRLYDPGREGFLSGEIVWRPSGGSVIKAVLLRGYTFSLAHRFVSELSTAGGTAVATTTLTVTSNAGGVADAADPNWGVIAAGAAIPVCVIYQASAVTGGSDLAAASQRLIAYIDTAPTLPITPNGQPVTGLWADTADRIFKL
jgi:hypothetical protein